MNQGDLKIVALFISTEFRVAKRDNRVRPEGVHYRRNGLGRNCGLQRCLVRRPGAQQRNCGQCCGNNVNCGFFHLSSSQRIRAEPQRKEAAARNGSRAKPESGSDVGSSDLLGDVVVMLKYLSVSKPAPEL